MQISDSLKEKLSNETVYSASKSGGPGGQHVNKVNTSVELRFSIPKSVFLNERQKQILLNKLKNRINSEGILILVSRNYRSQLRNKIHVTENFFNLLEKALTPVKKRKKTRPTEASRKKRLELKKKLAQKKERRKPPSI